jgi:hypothetical protein
MQFQPNLTELGLARVLLFETFCLPTLLRQSSQNYLWIIRTDPHLHDAVRQKFLTLVQPYSNIYVIASNENPGGFRSTAYMSDIQPATVWNGDYARLLRAHQASQTRLVLESRLDADDGLYTDFVTNLQMEAVQHLSSSSSQHNSNNETNSTTTTRTWKLWCVDVHLDWQLVSPWNELNPEAGVLLSVQPPICVTPGLTVGYSVDTKRSDFPGNAHHVLHQQIPACDDDESASYNNNGPPVNNCLSRFPSTTLSAIRARTVTSAGMGNVVLESSESSLTEEERMSQQQLQNDLWINMNVLFGISKGNATYTRRVLADRLSTIASENLKGQCIKGFTCKDASRTMLQQVATQGGMLKVDLKKIKAARESVDKKGSQISREMTTKTMGKREPKSIERKMSTEKTKGKEKGPNKLRKTGMKGMNKGLKR